jgi:sugar lactone lactonase YvrE
MQAEVVSRVRCELGEGPLSDAKRKRLCWVDIIRGRLYGYIPDGLTVDSQGNVWSARWDGSCVVRHTPDGSPTLTIGLPTPNITSLAFGGEDLQDLYVTSAAVGEPQNASAGALFRVRLDTPGRPEFCSGINH